MYYWMPSQSMEAGVITLLQRAYKLCIHVSCSEQVSYVVCAWQRQSWNPDSSLTVHSGIKKSTLDEITVELKQKNIIFQQKNMVKIEDIYDKLLIPSKEVDGTWKAHSDPSCSLSSCFNVTIIVFSESICIINKNGSEKKNFETTTRNQPN